jgi:predicted permease
MSSAEATALVMQNAFGAMMKIFLVSVIGVLSAKYPKGNPLLPRPVIQHISRFSNIVMVPCLIIGGLGSSLSINLLKRVGILIPFSIFTNILSFIIAKYLKILHESDEMLYKASFITVGSPNTISMPLMIMQSLCEQNIVNADYDNDVNKCFDSATALLFIYSIGFHIIFWGYAFPAFENLQRQYQMLTNEHSPFITSDTENDSKHNQQHDILESQSKKSMSSSQLTGIYKYSLLQPHNVQRIKTLINQIFLSPSMIAIFIGLFIGLIPQLQYILFSSNGVLYPIGGAFNTLASPVVALNCLIMSASLAHVDINFNKLYNCYNNVKNTYYKATHNEIISHVDQTIRTNYTDICNPIHIGANNSSNNNSNNLHDNNDDNLMMEEIEFTNMNVISKHSDENDDQHMTTENSNNNNDDKIEITTNNTLHDTIEIHEKLPRIRSVMFLIICRYTYELLCT